MNRCSWGGRVGRIDFLSAHSEVKPMRVFFDSLAGFQQKLFVTALAYLAPAAVVAGSSKISDETRRIGSVRNCARYFTANPSPPPRSKTK
jgi:hypothetical protein